nr:hypothetical protein [Micromonospora sp. WMMC415]
MTASYMACSQMPMEAVQRLNLPTSTVFNAASKAGWSGVQHVLGAHRIVLEPELADVRLRVDHVADQPVRGAPAVGGEEDVPLGAFDVDAAAEDGDQPGDVAIADVGLAAVDPEAALPVGVSSMSVE